MSLNTEEINLKVDQAGAGANQKRIFRKGQRLDVLFHLIKGDGTDYDLTGKTVEMDWEKEDQTGLFGSNKSLALVTAAQGRCKWVLTTDLDAIDVDDYIVHLQIKDGSNVYEVQETFVAQVRLGTP